MSSFPYFIHYRFFSFQTHCFLSFENDIRINNFRSGVALPWYFHFWVFLRRQLCSPVAEAEVDLDLSDNDDPEEYVDSSDDEVCVDLPPLSHDWTEILRQADHIPPYDDTFFGLQGLNPVICLRIRLMFFFGFGITRVLVCSNHGICEYRSWHFYWKGKHLETVTSEKLNTRIYEWDKESIRLLVFDGHGSQAVYRELLVNRWSTVLTSYFLENCLSRDRFTNIWSF